MHSKRSIAAACVLMTLAGGCGKPATDDTAAVQKIVENYAGKPGCKVDSVPGAQLTTATEKTELGESSLAIRMDAKAVRSAEVKSTASPSAGVMAASDFYSLVGDAKAWGTWMDSSFGKRGTFTTTINGWDATMVRGATAGGTPQFTLTVSRK